MNNNEQLPASKPDYGEIAYKLLSLWKYDDNDLNTSAETLRRLCAPDEAGQKARAALGMVRVDVSAEKAMTDDYLNPYRQCISELKRELLEQARLNGMGGEREANLLSKVSQLEAALAKATAENEIVFNRELENAKQAIAKAKLSTQPRGQTS